jgi:hypothetical protein
MDDTTYRLDGAERARTSARSDGRAGDADGTGGQTATAVAPDRPGAAWGGGGAATPRAPRPTGSRDEDRPEPRTHGGRAIRLAAFITANQEPILVEWEAFARTRGAVGGAMDVAALRDHAAEMLTVIAADLNTAQGPAAQAEKGKGRAPAGQSAAHGGTDPLTAAAEHGAGRAESGFTVEQMVSEFRALRASVIRLWMAAHAHGVDGTPARECPTRGCPRRGCAARSTRPRSTT